MNSEKVKTCCNLAEPSKEVYGSKRAVFPILIIINLSSKGKILPLIFLIFYKICLSEVLL
jgi:hypothetical protein